MTGHVFLTYSATDATDPYVQAVVTRLTSAGLAVHAQQETNAHTVTAATRQLVDACGALVPVIMPATVASERVRLEVEYAHARGKPVLALWVDGQVPPWLAGVETDNVAGRRPPSADFVEKLRTIALQASASGTPLPPLVTKRSGRRRPGPPPEPPPPPPPPRIEDALTQLHGRLLPDALPPPPAAVPQLGSVPCPPEYGPARIEDAPTQLHGRLLPDAVPPPPEYVPSPAGPSRRALVVLAVIVGLLLLAAASAAVSYVIVR